MKLKLLFSLLIFCTSANCFAQKIDMHNSKISDKDLGIYYLQKNKRQKTTGWILLGGGIGLITIGSATFDPFSENASTDVLLLVGGLSAYASIPFFISAAKNKGSAEILLRNENIPLSLNRSYKTGTSIGIGISLGK